MQTALFDRLKAGVGELWDQAQRHPFVDALGDGTLERGRFIHYLKQDYVYLTGYSRAIALASARAPDLQRMAELSGLLNETLNHEMQLHRDYCAEFGVSALDLEAVEPAPICQAYADFCVATAATGGMLVLLAALLPCGVGYGEIGQRLMSHPALSPVHPYRQWIYTYGGDEYQQYARWMIEALNELGAEATSTEVSHLTMLFRLGCRYEWLFWEMAWAEQDWPV